jgi:hypothetical protein
LAKSARPDEDGLYGTDLKALTSRRRSMASKDKGTKADKKQPKKNLKEKRAAKKSKKSK